MCFPGGRVVFRGVWTTLREGEEADAHELLKSLTRRIFGRSIQPDEACQAPQRLLSRKVSESTTQAALCPRAGGEFSGDGAFRSGAGHSAEKVVGRWGPILAPAVRAWARDGAPLLPFSLTSRPRQRLGATQDVSRLDPGRRRGGEGGHRAPIPRVPSRWILLFRQTILLQHTPAPE